jgi:hypothetical protein
MDTQIIVVYCLSADMLTALHHYENKQRQMSDAEVMTTAIVAMLYFKGNFCMASRFLYNFEIVCSRILGIKQDLFCLNPFVGDCIRA